MSSDLAVDREVVELLASEPALLAIADAVAATQPRPRRRRLTGVAAVAAVAAIVAVALAGLLSREPANGSLVPKALAAVGRGPVLHAELESPLLGTSLITLATGRVRRPMIRVDYYYDAERGLLRGVTRRDGMVLIDGVQSTASPTPFTLEPFVTGYKRELAAGRARRSGEGKLAGRDVIWLTVGPDRVAIDTNTFAPIAVTPLDQRGRPGRFTWRVLSVHSIPRSVADFQTHQPSGFPMGGNVVASRPVSSAQVRETIRWPAVWLGEGWRGLRLVALDRQTLANVMRGSIRRTGLRLRYERLGGGFVELVEAAGPEAAYGFQTEPQRSLLDPLPSQGQLELTKHYDGWSGRLETRGAYVALSCSSRTTCVAAARALKPFGVAS